MEMQNGVLIHKTEKANSREFGKAGDRYKIYFETAEDLKQQIDSLIALGLINASPSEE